MAMIKWPSNDDWPDDSLPGYFPRKVLNTKRLCKHRNRGYSAAAIAPFIFMELVEARKAQSGRQIPPETGSPEPHKRGRKNEFTSTRTMEHDYML
jgi:hypothetical protein